MRMFQYWVLLDFGSLIFICDHYSISMTALMPGNQKWSACGCVTKVISFHVLEFLDDFLICILCTLWSDLIFHRLCAKLVCRWEGGSSVVGKPKHGRWRVPTSEITAKPILFLLLPTRKTSSTTVGNSRSDKLIHSSDCGDDIPAYSYAVFTPWLKIFLPMWTQCTDYIYTWLILFMQFSPSLMCWLQM